MNIKNPYPSLAYIMVVSSSLLQAMLQQNDFITKNWKNFK